MLESWWGRGYALASPRAGTVQEDGECALGLQQGHTCKILCAAWHKIHGLGQLEFFFFFVGSKDFTT